MPTTQASPAVGATRPLRRRAATGRGGTSHQTQSSKRVRAKLMPLPSYRKRIFGVLSRSSSSARKRDLTEIEYPLLVKRVFSHPPPRHRGYAAKPPTATAADASRLCRPRRRRRPSGLRARYAGALRRGGEGLHTKRSLQEGKGKTDALTLLSQAYFRSAVKVKPLCAQARPDRDRIPAFSKAGIQPSPPRHRGYAAKPPTATAADASRLCRPRRRRRPSGLRARYAGALRRGGRDFTPNAVFQEGKGKTDALTLLSQAYFRVLSRSPLARKRDLDRDRIPAFSKAGIHHPPPRHRGYAAKPPTATAADASRLCRPRRRRRPSGLRARYAGALRRGGGGTSHQTQSSKRVRAN